MSERPPDQRPRVVKARKRSHTYRPIIAVSDTEVLIEATGNVVPAAKLPNILRTHPSSFIVCQGFGQHLQRLQQELENECQDGLLFNYRVTPIKRYARAWDDGKRLQKAGAIVDTICNYVGWQDPDKGRNNRYHYPIDPIWFLTASIDDLDDSNAPRLAKLFRWAEQVRQWCADNQLQVKASAGGLAAQLLRDPRFYPDPRRKAPRFINDIARFKLPGNYYRLHGDTGKYYRAVLIDMENAHHAMASSIDFPSVNSLHAHGYWRFARDESEQGRPQSHSRAYAPGGTELQNSYGLFYCQLHVPHVPHSQFPPPYMERPGVRNVFLYSNEFELVKSLGGEVTKIYAALASPEKDTGLNAYAKYAIGQIRKYPDYKPWLKPTLHAVYGLLAARPMPFETGYLRAKGGEPWSYPMGNIEIPALRKARDKEVESQIANVIHRGMIEAAVRKEALWFARYLAEVENQTVLAIYADAVFIEDNPARPLPILPPWWRVKETVKGLRFHSPVHFTSSSINRLPGVPRNSREAFLRTLADNAEFQRPATEANRRTAAAVAAMRKKPTTRPRLAESRPA